MAMCKPPVCRREKFCKRLRQIKATWKIQWPRVLRSRQESACSSIRNDEGAGCNMWMWDIIHTQSGFCKTGSARDDIDEYDASLSVCVSVEGSCTRRKRTNGACLLCSCHVERLDFSKTFKRFGIFMQNGFTLNSLIFDSYIVKSNDFINTDRFVYRLPVA